MNGRVVSFIKRELRGLGYYTFGTFMSSVLVVSISLLSGDASFSSRLETESAISVVYFCILAIPFIGYAFLLSDARFGGKANLLDLYRAGLSLMVAVLLFVIGTYVDFLRDGSSLLIMVPVFTYLYLLYSLACFFGYKWRKHELKQIGESFDY